MSNETNNNEYLLKVDHLKQYFPVHDGFKKMELKAVDDVSFAIKPVSYTHLTLPTNSLV